MTTKELSKYMSENFPLVKIIDFDATSKLFYDGRANMVFIVDNEDYPILVGYLRSGDALQLRQVFPEADNLNIVIARIDDLQQKGVLLPGPLDRLISTETSDIKAQVEYNLNNILMRKFVLETTQQCNFRCRYCHNTLEPVFRHHTKRQMSPEVAKASIDFYKRMYLKFYNRLPDEKKALLLEHFPPTIGFYGGEPTLNWNLVEYATDYYMNCGWEQDGINRDFLKLTLNSNLYILTDQMMSYLLKHRPTFYVSLDGPKEVNDRNRVTADGKGTFDRVYTNLMKIKACDAEYYASNLMILCVEANGNDIDAAHEMLDSIGCPIEYLQEEPYGCIELNPEEQIRYYDEHECEMIDDVIDRFKAKLTEDESDALELLAPLYFLDKVERDTPFFRRNISISLSCPLCVDNIMIDTAGDMHICHKTDGSLPLGNVCHGDYDLQKMLDAYRSYGELTNCKACRSCWAVNECGYCAAVRLGGGKWNNPLPSECALQRRRVEYTLKLFVAIYKLDPTILPKLMARKHNLKYYKSIVDYNDFIRL